MSVADRLRDLNIVLPTPAAPVAAYVGAVRTGSLLVVSGQLPMLDGKVAYTGKLGEAVDVPTGTAAARLCAINVLAQIQAALGDLERVARVVRLGGFIACAPSFTDHPKVMNGASELMLQIFGDAGRHARTTIGVPSLPLGACCEVEAWIEIKP